MKTTIKLLVGAIVTLWCSLGSAQNVLNPNAYLIYSNSFTTASSLPYTSVYETAPTYNATTNLIGASASAVWICTYTNPVASVNNPGASVPPYGAGSVYLNGDIGTNEGCALLPLIVQTNAIYILQSSLTLPSSMPNQIEMGFAFTNTSQYGFDTIGHARFNDNPPGGYAWDYLQTTKTSGIFPTSNTSGSEDSTTGDLTPSAGTYTILTILSTLNNTNAYAITNLIHRGETNDWVASSYVNGNQIGTNIIYAATATGNPTITLNYCGLGSSGSPGGLTSGNETVWNWFTVSTPLLPVVVQQPPSGSASEGLMYSNTVVALADTNGGTLFYKWYTNGIQVAGANGSTLLMNPVTAGAATTNDFVVITNTFGAITSSVFSITVFTLPTFVTADPITYTNLMTLFGGTNNGVTTYLGSNPSFSVLASGATPITYFWQTNGVAVGGATSTTFAFTNCQLSSPSSFSCIASNYLGTATNTWAVQYIPAPTASYPQTVIAAGAIAYWRLDETNYDPNQYNDGEVCQDYISGNNGIYTNTALYQPGYDPATDPTETSAQFGPYDDTTGDLAYSIGTNVDFSASSNAEFTVSVWANGGYGYGGTEPTPGGIVAKGYFNGEEFSMDDGAPSADARFEVRNAAGTAANANSTFQLGGNNSWNHLVGVCDESNGLVSFYINGVLAGQATITPGSGVEPDALIPITIGARDSIATTNGDQQFDGALDDVAVFNYALSPAQVGALYQSSGQSVTPYLEFLAPLPVTNVVYVTNATITISATAFGTPPIGFYWTNLTTTSVMGSGVTNVYGDLNASLSVQDVNGSLNGDVLELVVTNASGSTNWVVNDLMVLTNPAPSIPLGYDNGILYSNNFSADEVTLGGEETTAFNDLFGTNEWICTYTNGNVANCGTVYENGTLGTNAGNAVIPFTPETGYIYTMSGSLTLPASTANWISMGFEQAATPQVNSQPNGRFTDSPFNGYAWMYVQSSSAQAVFEPGPTTSVPGTALNGSVTLSGNNTMEVVLNCVTNNAWFANAYINGTEFATNYYGRNLPIAYAGIGQNQLSAGSAGIQWNSWSLTQYAPGGVPPFVVPPGPASQITNNSVTIPVTAYGSGPFGYYWTLNNNVIGSGANNTMSPLNAGITIPSSLGGGQLALTLTNAYGTNITLITLVGVVNTNPVPIMATVTNSNLYLTWPTDHIGWQLQAQTNSVTTGLSNNWANFNPSTGTNQVVIPINLTNGTVFYRLTY